MNWMVVSLKPIVTNGMCVFKHILATEPFLFQEPKVEGIPRWRTPFLPSLHHVIRRFCSICRTRVAASRLAESTVFTHNGHPANHALCLCVILERCERSWKTSWEQHKGCRHLLLISFFSLWAWDGPGRFSTAGRAGNLFTKGKGACSDAFACKL